VNNQGSVSITALVFILIVVSIIFLNYQTIVTVEKTIVRKSLHYLCFKELIITHKKLVKNVELNNIQIGIGNSLLLNPKTAAAGKTMIELAKNIQRASYLKASHKILKSKYCNKNEKAIQVMNLPYKPNFERVLNIAQLKDKEWKIILIDTKRKSLGFTQAKLRATGNGISNLKVTIKDLNKKALPLSNFLYGAEFL
jgi:hypothetical protein